MKIQLFAILLLVSNTGAIRFPAYDNEDADNMEH